MFTAHELNSTSRPSYTTRSLVEHVTAHRMAAAKLGRLVLGEF